MIAPRPRGEPSTTLRSASPLLGCDAPSREAISRLTWLDLTDRRAPARTSSPRWLTAWRTAIRRDDTPADYSPVGLDMTQPC